MLLNTWLTAAKRQLRLSSPGRASKGSGRRFRQSESLEDRQLLTALVINPDNQPAFTNASGGLEIDSADLAGMDSLVIEGISIGTTVGDAISINLSGISLTSLAIDSVTVTSFATTGFDIDLLNVTDLHTIAIEDISMTGSGRGVDLTLNNTDADALTIDDSILPGIKVDVLNGSDLGTSLITETSIDANSGFEGIDLNIVGGTADNFHIVDNPLITSPNRDFLRVDGTGTAIDNLSIDGNQIGQAVTGAGLVFRAEGDTFVQPFELTNLSTLGERVQTFTFDISDIDLRFDEDATTGKAFTPLNNSDAVTGLVSAVVSSNDQLLTLTFDDFDPGELLEFVIDIDLADGTPASIFGDDLIGAAVTGDFSGNRSVSGSMIGDQDSITASQFAVGPGVAGSTHGISINLDQAPLTNLYITDNTVSAAPGHGLRLNTVQFSDVTGVITGNSLLSSGRDGLRFDLSDSNFTGAVLNNNISNNGGKGISLLPVATRSGLVQAAIDSNPVIITSQNHGLLTGDEIIIQGMVNDDPTINHPGNGRHTITRIDNNRFSLDMVDGTGAGVLYVGGGAWYVPDFKSDGSVRGLVQIDMQTSAPQGTIRDATNAGPIVITSPGHGLTSGDRVRISNVLGNTAANGVHKITVIDDDSFSLDGTNGNGAYDTSEGFGTWRANVITNVTSSAQGLLFTAPGHGLMTGEEIRITGVQGLDEANRTAVVQVVSADTFLVTGVTSTGTYAGGGHYAQLEQPTSTGDLMPQRIGGNLITNNAAGGVHADLKTGTTLRADFVANEVTLNGGTGLYVESHSFGLGQDLPLDPNDSLALPSPEDISFDVFIGSGAQGDGNLFDRNMEAGIALDALDYATGAFTIRNNRITSSIDDNTASTPFSGEGILVRLTDDEIPAEAVSLLGRSVIDNNIIGVDNQGNEGDGISFLLEQRTRMQDLQITNNTFLNNGRDGFHFVRTEDADLNAVIVEKNRATNNAGDGFDFRAVNTVKDRLDFKINENVIDNNAQYGVRIDAVADTRLEIEFNQNTVTGNGHTPNGQGFHPNDNVPGSFQSAGGVGIRAFQQIDILFSAADTIIDSNIGDGFSVDAFNFFDTLILNATFDNVSLSNNTLTGLRSHGTSFGSFSLDGVTLDNNGEDGARLVSIDDKNDFFERRVGGMDVDFVAMASSFSFNGQSGLQLGQGVSAVLGDGTIPNANFFDFNGEDGLKITQTAGPHLMAQNSLVDAGSTVFEYIRRRHIEASTNFFRNNAGDGVDIGHFVQTEGGNVEHGDEVVLATHVSLDDAVITNNQGDGIEYLADNVLRISPIVGGGQDVEYDTVSSLTVENSRIVNNSQRGVDILNRHGADSFVNLINNDILSNGYEGVYVLNTASHLQRQTGPTDPLIAHIEDIGVRSDDNQRFFSVGTKQREVDFEINPHIELRVQDNLIESNGSTNINSVVPINLSQTGAVDESGVASAGWTHEFTTVPGTLGGLVLRVGAVDSAGRTTNVFFDAERPGQYVSNPAWELGLAGIDAEIFRNSFDGNIGTEVYIDAYTAQIPMQTLGNFNFGDTPVPHSWFIGGQGYRDPLSRIDLVFRENTGNSLDVTNGFAFLDNRESEWKSRSVNSFPPNHSHGNDPDGPWGDGGPYRFRNQQRTTGYFNFVGDDPSVIPYYWQVFNEANPPVYYTDFSFDGWGTSTWRVERDFEFDGFATTNPAQGFSDFYDTVAISIQGDDTQWDTGTNLPGFTGDTTWSLDRGDVFNVGAGLDPIQGDSLEQNDSFVGATDLGTILGAGYSVNSQAVGNTLSLHTKGDRDYYRFIAGGTGNIDINLQVTDAAGDQLVYMLYEIDPTQFTEEVAVLQAPNGTPLWVVADPGGVSQTLSANVTAGREYIIEVFGIERENVFEDVIEAEGTLGKSFFYGTARTYDLSIDAPNSFSGGDNFGSGGDNDGGGGSGGDGSESGGNDGGDEANGGGSLPGPPTASFVAVSPDPRSTSVSSVLLNFNEDVTGVDLADFTLTRNGNAVAIPAGAVTQLSAYQYSVNLGSVSGESGTYVLTLVASGSDIRDSDNNPLQADASDTWSVSNSTTIFADTPDTVPGDGAAEDVNGNTSLRSAVMEANANPGTDVITLGAGTYALTLGDRFEDEAAEGDLDILDHLIIRGLGPGSTIIDGSQLDRIFEIFTDVSLTLENLTVQNGQSFDGGGILNRGTLILRDVNVIDNEAFNQGGGLYNLGTVDGKRVSISRNLAGSRGGGIHNNGSVTLLNTTLSSNTAVSRGGAIITEDASGFAELINVTIANNHAGSRGGGLSTIDSGLSRLGNSILDKNTTDVTSVIARSLNVDMLGRVTSLGNNLVRILDAKSASGAAAGLIPSDRFGRAASPLYVGLNPLTNTGGGNGTWYHPLQLNGNAVDRGNNAIYPDTPVLDQVDQKGAPRLIEGDLDGVVTIDIGAVEFFRNEPVSIITATPNPAGLGEVVTFDGTQSTHTNPANQSIVLWEWDFSYDGVTFNVEGTGAVATRVFNTAGPQRVALRVTDNGSPAQSSISEITVVVGQPNKPVINRPYTWTTDLTPTFSWSNGTGTFALQVIDTATNQVVLDVSNISTNSYTPTTKLYPAQYQLIVTASNASGSTASDPYIFHTTRVDLQNPIGDIYDTTPVFAWGDVPGTSRYEIWVNRNQSSYIGGVFRNDLISGTTIEPGQSLGPGTFTWWIRAYDADDNPGDWSLSKQFSIVRPTVTSPDGPTLDTTPTFTWTDLGAPRYELWVNKVGGPQKIIHELAVQGTSYTPTTALPNGDYVVWVRTIASDGEAGLWSLASSFRMDYRVGPTTIAPTGVVVDSTPTFEWEAFDHVSVYDLWVDNLSTGEQQVIRVNVPQVEGASTITYTSSRLLAGDYRWWVRAVSVDGPASAWSAPTDFTIPVPSIISPRGNISTSLPLFQWNGVAEFATYELWVDNLTTGTSRVLNVSGITDKFYQTLLPLENGDFRAWVRGFDNLGNASQWSGNADFSITANVGNAPTGLTPLGTIGDNTPTFTWTTAGNAATYELLVKQTSLTGQPIVIHQTGIVGTSFTTTTTLAPGQNYRWWVRGISGDGSEGPWSQPNDFRVVSSDSHSEEDTGPDGLTSGNVMLASLEAVGADGVDVRSITVHPAQVMVHFDEQAVADVERDLKPAEASDAAAPTADLLEIDALMQQLAVDGLGDDDTAVEAAVPPAEPAASQSAADDEEASTAVFAAGLAALGLKRKRDRKSDD